MKRIVFGITALMSAFVLTACGGGNNASSGNNSSKDKNDVTDFPVAVKNDKEPIKDGVLEAAVATDSQFKGLFQWEFYEDAYDKAFMDVSHETLFANDDNFRITDDGAATLDVDKDKNTVTITIKDNVKWSDGVDVTAEDVIFPYEIIGHPDYTGIRYDDTFRNVVGMEDYHAGKADTISGIKKINERTVEIHYKKVEPSMLQSGGGIWAYAAPKHTLEGVAVKDMESSDQVRKHPVSFGPYYMSNIVPGESVEYLPNKYYWNGTPKLKKITMKSVPISSATEALNSKLYDMIFQMPTDTYDSYKDVKGYTNLGREQTSYTYLGFKLGKWDAKTKSVKYNPKSKMADKSLRQAMGYALDNDAVGERFYAGLRRNATTLIPPVFTSFHDDKMKGFTQDIDKAKKLLDDAGFKDVDGDGIREDKDGNKLTIKFASMSGGETAQPLADYYIQQWEKIGLRVEYTTGRLIEFNSFYDRLENDDPDIDIYQAAWSTGTDPNPIGLWGENAGFNYTRFESKENTKLIKDINSSEAFDEDVQKEAYKAWQKYAFEQAFAIPTLFRNEVLPVNKRVKDWDWSYNIVNPWAKVSVTSDKRE